MFLIDRYVTRDTTPPPAELAECASLALQISRAEQHEGYNRETVTGRMALMAGIIYALTSLFLGISAGLSAPRNHPANEGERGLSKDEKFRARSKTRANTNSGDLRPVPEKHLLIILPTLSKAFFIFYNIISYC